MRIPIAAYLIFAACAAFVLQMIPGFGFMLMILLAPMWSVVLINAAAISAGVEAVTGRISPVFAVVPLLWFGGYGVYYSKEQNDLASLKQQTQAANAATVVPFSKQKHSLVFEKESSGLITKYDIPVTYSYDLRNKRAEYRATRLANTSICKTNWNNKTYRDAGIDFSGFHDDVGIGVKKNFVRDMCLISTPAIPTLPLVRVNSFEEESKSGLLPVKFITAVIKMPNRNEHQIRYGFASPLKWFPLPMMGCVYPLMGSGKEECGFWFMRDSWVPIVEGTNSKFDGSDAAIAAALGLKPVDPKNRKASSNSVINDAIQTAIKLNTDRNTSDATKQLAWLDQVIKDPLRYRTVTSGFSNLNGRSDLLKPRLPRMMDVIERGAKNYGVEGTNAGDLIRLMETLPYDDVAPYLDRLKKVETPTAFKFKVPEKK
jgi:hypothetical protein